MSKMKSVPIFTVLTVLCLLGSLVNPLMAGDPNDPYLSGLVPANDSVRIGSPVTLSWTPNQLTATAAYRVYLNPINDPNFIGVTPLETGDPSLSVEVAFNTAYLWRVDIVTAGNTYQGGVNQFRTEGPIDTPVPANGATRVPLDLTQLSWRDIGYATATYEVYFDSNINNIDPNKPGVPATDNTIPISSLITGDALAVATTYYFRVVTVVGAERVVGTMYSFTTGGDIVNLTPAAGSTGIATDLIIRWTAEAAGSTWVDSYAIYLGTTLPATPTATVTVAQWQAPALLENTAYQCKVVALHAGAALSQATSSFTTGKLVGHWPFDNTLTDLVGGNAATAATPHYTVGIVNEAGAVEFYGEAPVTVPVAGLAGQTSWTISGWENSDPGAGGSGVWETIIGCGSDNDGWGTFEFGRLDSKRYVLGFSQAGGTYRYTPNNDSYGRGAWHFHAICYDSIAKQVNWYVNGVRVNVYNGPTITLDAPLTVGNVKGLSQPFTGKVDDLKLYSRPLSAGQVLTEYVNGVGGAPILPAPASGAREVAWDVVLEWIASGSATGHTIEIGKLSNLSDATPIALTAETRRFDVVAGLGYKLDLNTDYYWRVTSTLPDKTVAGPIWLFTVRGLEGDVNADLAVDTGDVASFASVWLDDTTDYPPSVYAYLDQEGWSLNPNVTSYAVPWGASAIWGWGETYLDITPSPASAEHNPGAQTFVWRYNKTWIADGTTGSNGTDVGMTLTLPRNVDFTQFDKFGYWVYQTNCAGSADIRVDDQGGVVGGAYAQRIYHDWYDIGNYNNRWHNYEWTIPAGTNVHDVGQIRFYRGLFSDKTATEEFSDFYLVKDNITVKLCLSEFVVNEEDLNEDCMVDLNDVAIMALDWLLDASNRSGSEPD